MSATLFERGLAPRLALACVYGVLAFAAVATVHSCNRTAAGGPAPAPAAAAASTAAAPATLCIESIRPVVTWEVRLDGAVVPARQTTPTLWLAEVAVQPGSSLVVTAGPASDGGETPANSLRIRIAGTSLSRDGTFWVSRGDTVAVRLDALPRTATPLHPEDLP